MNKEQMTQEQRAQLIEKLRAEYKDLNGKIARLNAFLCDIDFVKKVPDPIEQSLMSMQLRSMKGYLDNLRARIMFQEGQQLREENDRKQIDEWKKMKGHIIPVNLDEQHQGIEQLETTIAEEDKYKPTTAQCVDDLLHRATDKFKELIAETDAPECNQLTSMLKNFYALRHGIKEVINIDLHHCGQDASCQVGDGSAAVDKPVITGESLKQLMDYQVIGVCEPGFPCEGCVQDHYNTPCVKLELVGGTYLCLAPLPNSIITE